MSNLRVHGMVRLERSSFEDGLSMYLAQVDKTVNLSDAQFDRHSRIIDARIGGDLDIRRATFHRGFALSGAKIGGSLLAKGNTTIKNGLACDLVTVAGNATFESATFSFLQGEKSHQVNTFQSALITGNFELKDAKFDPDCKLDLTDIKIGGELNVEETRWPTGVQSIEIRGMNFHDVVPTKVKTFLDLLEKSKFDPDAYASMERFLRANGHPDDANEVGLAQAKRLRRERLSFFPWLWSVFLYVFVGNGYAPRRVLVWAAGIVCAGAALFRRDRMVARQDSKAEVGEQPKPDPFYVSLLYSLDLFVPAVNLGIASRWEPKPGQTKLMWWTYFQRVAGWILVPIGILAFSGFIKG